MKLKANLYYILILSIACMHVVAKAETNKQKKFLDYIGNMESLEADYKQDVSGRKGTIISSNKGHFMFKSPNLFRMQSQDNSLTINDGNYLWQFEPELEQVIKTKINGDDHALTAMSIINNIKSIEEHYNIKAEKRVYRGTKYCLTDKTNPKNKIWFSFNNSDLTNIEYYDNLQNLISINFSNISHNRHISSKWFSFIPDPSFDIIEQ